MKQLLENKQVARDKIIQFLMHGNITLHADEERMMTRWLYADALIRGKRLKRDEIVSEITKKFEVSKFTADADIRNAHAVFARSRQINRSYLLGNLIEDITLYIEKAKRDPDLKKIVPNLYKELRAAIADLPDEMADDKLPPSVIMFKLFDPEKFKTGMTPEEAMAKAKDFLKKQAIEDIDYEDAE